MAPVGVRTQPFAQALRNAGLPVRTLEELAARELKWKAAIADMVEQLLASCTSDQLAFLKDFIFKTPERIEEVRKLKQGSKEWAQARIGLVTMSNAGKFLGHNPYNADLEASVQEAVFSTFTGNEYTKWGTEHEGEARDQYVSIERPKIAELVRAARAAGRATFTYSDRQFPVRLPADSKLPDTPEGWFYVTHDGPTDGLSISEDYNWLGCSPDGIIYIMGQAVGCLEIKCPAGKPLQCYVLSPCYYVDQVMGQMLFLNVTFCHFFVWTPTKWTMSKMEFDLDYCYGTVVRFLTELFFCKLLPLMTTHRDVVVAQVMSRADREPLAPSTATGTPAEEQKRINMDLPDDERLQPTINRQSSLKRALQTTMRDHVSTLPKKQRKVATKKRAPVAAKKVVFVNQMELP